MRPDLLETLQYEYPGSPATVDVSTDEFTAVCPWSGLPDFGTLRVRYLPGEHLLELRSVKFYLLTYRNVGIFQEHAANRILEDLVRVCSPTMDGARAGLPGPGGCAHRGEGALAGRTAVKGPAGRIAEIAVVAAAYAALTIYLAPASYGPVQFRFAEILKPLVIWEPQLIPAFVLGNFLGNLMQPVRGALGARVDAVRQPRRRVGVLAARPDQRLPGGGGVRADHSGRGVHDAEDPPGGPVPCALSPILASEVVLLVVGVPVMRPVHLALRRAFGNGANGRVGA